MQEKIVSGPIWAYVSLSIVACGIEAWYHVYAIPKIYQELARILFFLCSSQCPQTNHINFFSWGGEEGGQRVNSVFKFSINS